MASVHKPAGRDCYYVKLFHPVTKVQIKKSTGTGDYRAAQRFARDLERNLRIEAQRTPRPATTATAATASGPTIAELVPALSARAEPADDGRPEPLMTPEQAAAWAQVSVDTLDRWRPLGLRSYGGGRIRRYRASDILDYLASLENESYEMDPIDERARRAAREIQERMHGQCA